MKKIFTLLFIINLFFFYRAASQCTVTIVPTPADSTICNGQSVSLNATTSGTCGSTTYLWNTGASTQTLNQSPTSQTTYTVTITYSAGAGGTASDNIIVRVNQPSVAPSSISGTSTICNGQSTTLTVTGGTLGTGATWHWYSGSCGGTAVGTGTFINVTPAATITYFVRAEGTSSPCTANTACASKVVTVNQPSAPPAGITGTSTICNGQSTTLTVTGGTLGTGASWHWYSVSCGGTAVGTGTSVTVSPAATTIYFVRAEGPSPCINNTSCVSKVVTVNQPSVAPTGISGTSTICSGQSTTLTVSGGTLGSGATWQWYSGSCGGTAVGTGTSITVSPPSTTTYFVRAEGTASPCTANSACASQVITVNQPSVAPAAVTGTAIICNGQSTTLTVSGGTLGTGGSWHWYSGSCGGTAVGTGTSVTVSPAVTTTYFVRAEDPSPCNTITSCASQAVTVNQPSVAPSGISGTLTICNGQSTTLTLVGGTLGTGATWHWYSGSCGGTAVGTGTSVTVSPIVTTTYFVRAEGTTSPCTANSSCASQVVTVNQPSVAPTGITGTAIICNGQSTTLTVSGGTLGTGASWHWYSGSCGGTAVGTGTSITVSPASTITYFVRAEDGLPCNSNTACVSQVVTVNQPSVAPTGISGTSTICNGQSTTLTMVGGTLGTGATWHWYSGTCGGTSVGTGTSVTVSPVAATTYFVRAEGTASPCTANSACASQVVTVNQPSVAPTGITGISTICNGQSTTLTVSGGTLGTGASWQWYSGSCGGTAEGTGTSITVSPASGASTTPVTITYFVRAENTAGPCTPNTNCVSMVITINPIPVLTSPVIDSICSGSPINYLVIPSFSSNVTCSWSTNPVPGITGNVTGGNSNCIIQDVLENQTSNQQITVPYTVTLTYTNNGVSCSGNTPLTVIVNPSPPTPDVRDLTLLSGVPDSLCGGTEFNSFNITNNTPFTYQWNSSITDTNLVSIKDSFSLNTVITFNGSNSPYTVTLTAIAFNVDNLGHCPNVGQSFDITVSPGNTIVEQKVILKQPGNLLVYLDNTVDGYLWGYDSISNGKPVPLREQVYQAYPAGTSFKKDELYYWVLVYKGNCVTKVYYNGPYAKRRSPDAEIVSDEITALVTPNPNNGNFDLLIAGNIYGNVRVKIVNTLGQVVAEKNFEKITGAQNYFWDVSRLSQGLYLLQLEGSRVEENCVTKLLIK